MGFQPVDMETWVRKPYFEYYINQIKCRYTLNAQLDITGLLKWVKVQNLRFYPALLYAATKAMNQNKEFRMAYDAEGQLGYWDEVNPSYTIFHEDDHTFSDLWTEWNEDFMTFYTDVTEDMQRYGNVKGIKGKEGQPANTYPISAAPWLSFTGYSIDTYEDSQMLMPILTFGKYFAQGDQMMIPMALFTHHAVADGYHACRLINEIQEILQKWGES